MLRLQQIRKHLPGRSASGLMLAALVICLLTFSSLVFGDSRGDAAGAPRPACVFTGADGAALRAEPDTLAELFDGSRPDCPLVQRRK